MKLADSCIYHQDIESVTSWNPVFWKSMAGSSILITGSTGLIGSLLVSSLLAASRKYDLHLRILCIVRNIKQFYAMFGEDNEEILLLQSDVSSAELPSSHVDYIFHFASMTSSEAFVTNPVEVLDTNLCGTKHMLELARKAEVKRFVYLSTMEVYGTPQDDTGITEDFPQTVDAGVVRSCYPVSKIACESLCRAYASEYGVRINIFRLAQTFGPGVKLTDQRLFAYLSKCAVYHQNIILKTKGSTKRNYLYTSDAIKAIFTGISDEKTIGETYNAANEQTYCSVYDMAKIASKLGNIQVSMDLNGDTSMYAPPLHMNLKTEKIKALGWTAEVNLEEMLRRLITFFQEQIQNGDE